MPTTVELMGRYSNPDIVSSLQRILAGHGRDGPSNRTVRSLRQKQRRLAADEVSEVLQRYQAGETANALAQAFDVHRTTIVRHLEAAEVSTRYRILSEADLAEARRMYERGWSLARLGGHFGVATRTVLNAFQRVGVPTRPVGTNQWSTGSQS
jgi:DNA-binding transcriptional ArsR family regulator